MCYNVYNVLYLLYEVTHNIEKTHYIVYASFINSKTLASIVIIIQKF